MPTWSPVAAWWWRAIFTDAVLALADDAPRRETLGRAARAYAEANLGHCGAGGV